MERLSNNEPSSLRQVVDRNLDALMRVRREAEEKRGMQQRIADGIGRFAGSMVFVYIHLLVFGFWIVGNLGLVPGIRAWDPYPFVMLAMFASVEAIFLSTFVLINQNRMAMLAETRADLDLQISLLTEHELTRLIRMVEGIAESTGAHYAKPSDLSEIKKDIPPEIVLERIERSRERDMDLKTQT